MSILDIAQLGFIVVVVVIGFAGMIFLIFVPIIIFSFVVFFGCCSILF
ncbi:hypothetical protein [Campylobacter fetus]|nr:hypothetical protein [Campylobacter fetus]